MCCGVVSILCSLSQGQSFLFLISLQVQVTGKPLVILFLICVGNSMISCDTWHKYHKWYFEMVICEIWDNFEISRTNNAIICLYYYPHKGYNFHM